MTFDIVTMCYNYQRRWVWQLSSLLEQVNAPDFCIHIAYVKNNGNPKTEDIIDYYESKGLKFHRYEYDSIAEMAYRGLVRNAQTAQCTADWVYYNDPDHIYPKNWLREINEQIEPLKNRYRTINHRHKITTEPHQTQTVINAQGDILYIKDAYSEALSFPRLDIHLRGVAGGCMQIVRREHIIEKNGGYFMRPELNVDRHIFKQRTWSDVEFRNALGRTRGINLSEMQVHLNHSRSGEPDYDTAAQR